MNSRIELLRNRYVVEKEQIKLRKEQTDPYTLAVRMAEEKLDDLERSVRRLKYMLDAEEPVVFDDERIALLRTNPVNYEIFTEDEFSRIRETHYIHEQGKVCNINPCYSLLLDCGFRKKREEIRKLFPDFDKEPRKCAELNAFLQVMDDIEIFAGRYREAAQRAGNTEIAEMFGRIPMEKPSSFQEALQFLRLLHYCLWCSFNYHNTFGRFDQYMYSYFKADMDAGRINQEEALELLEEFFISCNKDSDLYPGMQQGDNGQSMVLGGLNIDGSESFNELSELCLQASLELRLIDPKINLRVNRSTPVSMYERGTDLTKQGLGFPQYSNDDVVIAGLKRWGYDEKDAYNYVVAACWEFIIPGCGMDIVNVNGLSFPTAVTNALKMLPSCSTFEEFLGYVKDEITKMAEELCDSVKNLYMEPSPLMSLMMKDCVENARDIAEGNKYNNFGFHGTGLSTAVDSLASVRKYVYQDKMYSARELLEMLTADYKGYESIQNMLRYEGPKMGNDDDEVDELAIKLLDWFADALEGKKNERGGIYRAGTGSAMYYVWQAQDESATPDGRNKGEEFACNYSPSLFSRLEGPVSIIKSFSKPHLERVVNGGPLTIELHDTLFRNEDSIRKVAVFVKSFMDLGGHQMQINAVNRSTMLDAKEHPENHKNLIVRVWGWSGYFVELDEVYQNQIIKRMELTV
ncbi:MAG: pyruvate formate lyase family protein [Lachnospiraceae bacterium]|nr:pyruvate formate lyase family protein [Lachnospiraceae bacterium]